MWLITWSWEKPVADWLAVSTPPYGRTWTHHQESRMANGCIRWKWNSSKDEEMSHFFTDVWNKLPLHSKADGKQQQNDNSVCVELDQGIDSWLISEADEHAITCCQPQQIFVRKCTCKKAPFPFKRNLYHSILRPSFLFVSGETFNSMQQHLEKSASFFKTEIS